MPPQNARERSDLTRQIKSILDGYPFGIAILRELLQNSDDAQATTQTFILDCRTHGTESLAHPALVGCQGPALLAVNDSVFKDPEDWEALRKLHGSNKALDENKTGKYGLGFRANYHLTDNPHVLSGDRLYIADPHERLPGVLNGGAYFSLKDGDGVEYSSHFNAFQAAGVDSRSDYVNQTIIRLPLRTASQAEISEICKTPTTIEGIRTLFKSFITNELDIILLFLRNVTRIEVVEVGEDGRGILLGRAMLTKSTNPPAVSRAATYLSSSSLFDYLVVSFDQPEHRTTWRSYRRTYDRRYVSNILSSRLCRSAEQLEQDLRQDKLVAEVALAYCLDPNLIVNGRLFASLPLPESISPKIPIHVHGNFALTSDRQHLKNFDQINDQENKRHRDGLLAHWNKAIFEEFIPPAWAALLEALAQDLKERNRLDEVWSAFPLQVSDSWGGHWGKILDSVLREVIESKFCVFPTTALGVQLPSVLQGLYIVDQRDSTCPWEILSRLGIMVAAPPIPIYELIKATSSILTPGPLLNELQQRVQALEQCTDPEKDAIIKYLLSEKQATLDMVLGLPIIPLASGKRIRLERQPLTRVHIVQGLGDRAVDAWMKLGIPFLDPEVPYNKVEPFGVTLKEDVTFFVEHVDPSRIAELLSSDWDEINASLTSVQRISFLGDKNLLIFKQFPIFPIRANLAEGEEGEKVSITHQGAIIGDHVFVQSSHNYPLPVLPLTTTFVDVRIEAGISRLLGGPPRMLGELGLLQMALEHWDIQPHYLRQRFLPRILARLTEMPSSIERVRNLPFITVGGRILPPHEVIDPESPIAGLYEDGDLPCKDFATHSMFGLLRMHGLICNKLTPELLNKRIHWISHNTHCSLPKAIHLLTVMDDEWDNRFITEVDGCRSLAWIPTADEALVSPSACFFNDYPNYHENSGRFGHEVSPIMTSLLAQRLKIPFLSALLADEDSGSKDEEAMSVELLSRIHAVLHDYDINYAVNEFIANAHDAGATEFSMMLDEMKRTEKDFKGILEIDKGGKLDNPDVIGRYGLGALSLFYFTDVVTIISGKYILIMDPSGEYLPHTLRGQKRTALRRTIASIYRNSSSHLRPFVGKYGCDYEQHDFSYDGTMFRLPLYHGSSLSTARKPMNVRACRELLRQYEDLAHGAFFFTRLTTIDSRIRDMEGSISSLWTVKAEREICHESEEITMKKLTLPGGETWFVSQTRVPIPDKFQDLPYRLKVRDSFPINVALPSKPSRREGYLFSVLQLPSPISIPSHLNAPFALPSSRRGIHFDPARDSTREQSINDTEWNRWILSIAFPPFYLSSLSILKNINARSISLLDYFPPKESTQNNIGHEISSSFYFHLLKSEIPLFRSTTGVWKSCNSAIFLSSLPDDIKRNDIETTLKHLSPTDVILLSSHLLERLPLVPYVEATIQTKPRVISPAMFRELVGSHAPKIQELYNSEDLDMEHITSVLQLILADKNHPHVVGLPLLLVGKGTRPELLPIPPATSPVWYTPDDRIRSLLVDLTHPEPILHGRVPQHVVELMLAHRPPIITQFELSRAVGLIQERLQQAKTATHSQDVLQWIELFWELFDHFPKLRDVIVLREYPLIPTLQAGKYVSAQACTGLGHIVPYDLTEITFELLPILHEFGFEIVDTRRGPHLYTFIGSEFPQRLVLTSILKGLVHLGKTGPNFSTVPNHEKLASWIRESWKKEGNVPVNLLDVLGDLPIWPAQQGDATVLCSAKAGVYLPPDVTLDSNFRPQAFNHPLIIYDTTCTPSIQKLNGNQLALSSLLPGLSVPNHLPDAQLESHAVLLEKLCRFSDFKEHINSILVPDGKGKMKPVYQFYKSTIPLFAASFGLDHSTKFIHPLIRENLERIPELPLIQAINPTTLLDCLKVFDEEVRSSREEDDLIQRAQRVHTEFTTHVGILPFDDPLYSQLKSLRFIVRTDYRSSSATYSTDPYVGPGSGRYLPRIISPSQVIHKGFEAVAWTQKGILDGAVVPTAPRLASIFGVPSTIDVIQHLRVLVRISHNHPANQSLLRDIKETYKWLDHELGGDEDTKVRGEVKAFFEERLFLNVDDPEKPEEWVWNSAREIIINLHVDRPHNQVFGARKFLDPYTSLLLSAGCQQMVDVTYDMTTTHGPSLPATFNAMRRSRQSTDMELVPQEKGWITASLSHLHCHSVVLEGVIPHFRSSSSLNLLNGSNSLESHTMVKSYPVATTHYGAAKLLEFVYTGGISLEKPHLGNLDLLLFELLGLLPVAYEWKFDGLKAEIGRIVVKELKLLDIVNHKTIHEQAKAAHAADLLKACQEFEKRNAKALQHWGHVGISRKPQVRSKMAKPGQIQMYGTKILQLFTLVLGSPIPMSVAAQPLSYQLRGEEWIP